MDIRAAGRTDIGRKRQNNEDSLLVDDRLGLYVVADGIGGQSGGEVASRMAVESLRDRVKGGEGGSTALVAGFQAANNGILTAARATPALESMGTTMTALLVERDTVQVAHVGDSRAYLLRDGQLEQLTDDHGLVAEQVRAGLVTPDQARRSPYRHIITRALGMGTALQVDVRSVQVRRGDLFLLCTDGLTEMVGDEMLAGILSGRRPDEAADQLVAAANANGGVDNITVVVVRFDGQ
jgi:protein phosphatase